MENFFKNLSTAFKATFFVLMFAFMGVMLMTPRDYQQGYAYALQILGVPMGGTGLTNLGAKGALIAAADPTTFATVAVGSDGQVLTACSGQTAGVKWAAAGGGGGGTPGGVTSSIQYKNACGAFAGSSCFLFQPSTDLNPQFDIALNKCGVSACFCVTQRGVQACAADSCNNLGTLTVSPCCVGLSSSNGLTASRLVMCGCGVTLSAPSLTFTSGSGCIRGSIQSSNTQSSVYSQYNTNHAEVIAQGFCGYAGLTASTQIILSAACNGGLIVTPTQIQVNTPMQLTEIGTGTLSGGTATISAPALTSKSAVFVTDTNTSTTNVGAITVTSQTPGTGFTVTSTNGADTSTFNWMFFCTP